MEQAGAPSLHSRIRNTASTYDFVKVRVWLTDGDGGRSSHVLSRFLLARTLTAALVPYELAVKVSLEVKKHLVDAERLDVSQEELEELTFRLLRARGQGEEALSRFTLLSAFHRRRQPLVLLIGGGPRACKSSVGAPRRAAQPPRRAHSLAPAATQLAQRLNWTNTLQTDWVHRLLAPRAPAATSVEEYEASCRCVCDGVSPELSKVVREGKTLIVEGLHVHPALFRARLSQLAAAAEAEEAGRPRLVVIAVLLAAAPDAPGAARDERLRACDALLSASHARCEARRARARIRRCASHAPLQALRIEATPERLPTILERLHLLVLDAMGEG